MRPTCVNCGEALGATDDVCRRCREPIGAPAGAGVLAAPAAVALARPVVAAPPARPDAAAPALSAPPVAAFRRRSRLRVFAQLLAVAVVAGAVVTGALLALELFAPRSVAPFDLVHASFPALGFSVSRPNDWTVAANARSVTFTAPGGSSGFRVVSERTTLDAAREAVARQIRQPGPSIDPIGISAPMTVDGQPAFRYSFDVDDSFIQQWWIGRPGGTFRLEFWDPESSHGDAGQVAQSIVDSFTVG